MYDKKLKRWISDCNTDELKRMINDPEYSEDEDVLFLKTSDKLSKIEKTENIVQAVATMEALAKNKHLPAVFAMGQMCFYGWGVSKNRKRALEWYGEAAKEGYKPAINALAEIKRQKRNKIITAVASFILVTAVVFCAVYFTAISKVQIIKVNDKTELTKVTTTEEFSTEIKGLISEYDSELVISGQVSTNRILLKFEGNKLDLSNFLADKVIARENNIVIIQFSDEQEAQRCLEMLKKEKKIIFAETDNYDITTYEVGEDYCTLSPLSSTDPTDRYISWGVADMGLDQLSGYVRNNFSDEEILVAVVDSGALEHSAFAGRYVEGLNTITNGAIVPDDHGTHVAGTILDGANSENISVINFDVFNGSENTSALAISLGVEMAIEVEADVINMSLGGPCSQYKEESIKKAIDSGIVVVVAAGNDTIDSTLCGVCPAHMDDVITVGAYEVNHQIAYFSNYGDCLDVCAPGVEIWNLSPLEDNAIQPLQGTSMASPHVAAMAALLKSIFPDATPAEIKQMICDSCRTFTNPQAYSSGKYGMGAPDATIFIEKY